MIMDFVDKDSDKMLLLHHLNQEFDFFDQVKNLFLYLYFMNHRHLDHFLFYHSSLPSIFFILTTLLLLSLFLFLSLFISLFISISLSLSLFIFIFIFIFTFIFIWLSLSLSPFEVLLWQFFYFLAAFLHFMIHRFIPFFKLIFFIPV
jgi:hypothetical protein